MHTLGLLSLYIFDKNGNGVYRNGLPDPRTGNLQESMITSRWIPTFCGRYRIVGRTQLGQLKMSTEKTNKI